MPFTIADVEKHNKNVPENKKQQWVDVANSIYKKCLAGGGKDSECAATAIKQANGVIKKHTNNYSIYENSFEKGYVVKKTVYQGRDHLVVPVVMMVEGVHNGSHGPLFHSIDELGKYPQSWNGIPIVINHPQKDGEFVSANAPDIEPVGRVYNSHVDGQRLMGEAWLDELKLQEMSPVVLQSISNSKVLEVSLGMFTDDEPEEGNWKGENYSEVAKNHRPDHLAILPSAEGACSTKDGCGLGVNQNEEDMDTNATETAMESKRKELGMSVGEFYAIPRNPPSASHLPIFDEAHVKAAMSRFNQVQGASSAEKASAKRKIMAKAHKYGIDVKSFKDVGANEEIEINVSSPNYMELLDKAQQAIRTLNNGSPNSYHSLEAVHDKHVIYRKDNSNDGTSKHFKNNYSVDEKGNLVLDENPTEVVKQVKFVNANEDTEINAGSRETGKGSVGTMVRTRSVSINLKKKGVKMAENNCTPCIEEKINALIEQSQGKWTEDDREFLQTLDEAKLDKMMPITIERTVEKEVKVNVLSEEDQVALATYKKQLKDKRDGIIKTIQDAKGKEEWPDEVLANMKDDVLQKVLNLVNSEKKTDYSLLGGQNIQVNEDNLLLPPGVTIQTKK